MKSKEAEARLVEVTSMPVIYVDDFAKIVVERGNVRITFIEYRTFGTERVKMPVLEIVRPIASFNPERFARLLGVAMQIDGGEDDRARH